jgi:Ca2+-binding RTX toxin-like protein
MPIPTTLIAPFKVLTSASEESQPVVVASPDGRFVIAWSAVVGAENDIRTYTYAGNYVNSGGVGIVSGNGVLGKYSSAIQANPDVAFLANGNAVLTYEAVVGGNRDIYFDLQVKNADGTYTTTISEQVANSGSTAGDQFQPEVASLTDGGFAIAWKDANLNLASVQRFTAAGIVNGGYTYAITTNQATSNNYNLDLIGLQSGGFALTYWGLSGGSKVSAIYGTSSFVNDLSISDGTSGSTFETSLAQSANGNIAFAINAGGSGLNTVVRIMSSSFVPITGDIVLTNAANSGETPRIAAMLDNRFMVVYSSSGSGPLVGQMINANGTLDGAAFTISATGYQAEIETLADGRVMVTWREGTTGAGDIYAAMYDPREAGVTITGTSGNDNYVGSSFGDTINSDSGDDFIVANGGADVIDAGLGIDTIYGGEGDNTIDGGGNADLVVGGSGNELLQGGLSSDTIFGEGGNDRIYAATLADPFGSSVGDILIGGFGNDSIYGSNGADYLYGGAGNDSMEGNANIDVFIGEGGDDTMRGGNDNDAFYSGDGVNLMFGDAGDDVFISEGGSDLMEGGIGHNYYYRVAAGASQINGGTGIDEFVGGTAASGDAFYGNDGNDFAYGGNGDDVLVGQLGNDVLIGQNGNDTLEGGAGVNLLWANDVGNDQIRVVVSDGGTQVVEFFEAGGANDAVRLLGSTLTSFAGIQNLVTNIGVAQGANLMVNAGSGAQLYLNLGANQTAIWFQGVSAYSLTSGDFLFV